MEVGFLLDSNVVIDFLGAKLPDEALDLINAVVDEVPNMSVITRIEVLSYKESEEEYSIIKNFCFDANVIELTEEIITMTIEIRLLHKIKTPDAIIAATAITNNMALITRNTSDFKNIHGLVVINPWAL